MSLKASLKPDHIPVNKYEFAVVGLVPLTFVSIDGIEEELDTTVLPDRTRATGGNTQPGEFTAMAPFHHTAEHTALEVWYQEAKDPVSSTYKKPVTLTFRSGTGAIVRQYTLTGVFITGRKLPEAEMENEGEIALVEWSFSYDDILPI